VLHSAELYSRTYHRYLKGQENLSMEDLGERLVDFALKKDTDFISVDVLKLAGSFL
jgi:hypothetical protein